jgi:hypothetical protein
MHAHIHTCIRTQRGHDKLIVMGDREADLDACEGLEGRFQGTLKVSSPQFVNPLRLEAE